MLTLDVLYSLFYGVYSRMPSYLHIIYFGILIMFERSIVWWLGPSFTRLRDFKKLKAKVDWEVAASRRELLEELYPLLDDWSNGFYQWRDIFRPKEIESLLQESAESASSQDGKNKFHSLVRFVLAIGYRHEPEVDRDGRPVSHRTTPLHRFARQEHESTSESFIELFKIYDRFDVNYVDESGLTHFHVACKFNCEEAVEKFLEEGLDPNLRVTETMDSPLHLAVNGIPDIYDEETGHDRYENTVPNKRVTEMLLRAGADPRLVNERGETPLHVICKREDDDDLIERFFAICYELDLRVQINAQDRDGNAPLHLAVGGRRLLLVQALLRAGADLRLVNERGETLLHAICKREDDDDFMERFLAIYDELGLRVQMINAQDRDGNPPLHLAVGGRRLQLVQALLRAGADPRLVNERGETVLHAICKRKDDDDDLMERFLAICDELGLRVRVDAQDRDGNAPLHLAVRRRRLQSVQALLRAGADPNLADAERSMPLHLMCRGKFYNDLVRSFFAICETMGQTVHIDVRDREGRTPLQLAVASLSPDVVDELLNRGADFSSFVFPSLAHLPPTGVQLAAEALAVVDHVEKRIGYEMVRNEALKVMRVFDLCGLFERYEQSDFPNNWYNVEEFADRAREIAIEPELTLHDLVQLRPDKAAKLFTPYHCLRLAASDEYMNIPQKSRELCSLYLFEMMSKRFFRDWATEPYFELTKGRFPLECGLLILDKLRNVDLYRIVLAAQRLNS